VLAQLADHGDRDRARSPADAQRAEPGDQLARAERLQREACAAAEREQEHPEPERGHRRPRERQVTVGVAVVVVVLATEHERRDQQRDPERECREIDGLQALPPTGWMSRL
jgi:hypothetical protein